MIVTLARDGLQQRRSSSASTCEPARPSPSAERLERIVGDEAVVRRPVHRPVAGDEALHGVVLAQLFRETRSTRPAAISGAILRAQRLAAPSGSPPSARARRSGRRAASSSSGRTRPRRRARSGPTIAKSRSTKLTSSLAPKYSLPRLRPPTIATRLSAIQVLLCMRRLMRSKLPSASSAKLTAPERDLERIEHPHLDVRVRVERREAVVLGACVHVVDQQAHLDAAVGGLEQLLGEETRRSGRRARCRSARRGCARRARGARADRECLGSLAHEPEPGCARDAGLGGRDRPSSGVPAPGRQRRVGRQAPGAARGSRSRRPTDRGQEAVRVVASCCSCRDNEATAGSLPSAHLGQ